MKFEEILPHLKNGEKAYREKYFTPKWDFNKHYIYFEHEEVINSNLYILPKLFI